MGDPAHTQIAFFGGSFTALPRDYMLGLLEAVQPFLRDGLAGGIRLSTRPDYMDRETAALLASYGVTAVELGAQSLWDPVLEVNERGHTARDVYRAAACVRAQDMELGLQMMTGLYGSTPETDLATGRGCIAMKPDTMRIYPTVVLPGTRLARLYADGAYPMLPPFGHDRPVRQAAGGMRRRRDPGDPLWAPCPGRGIGKPDRRVLPPSLPGALRKPQTAAPDAGTDRHAGAGAHLCVSGASCGTEPEHRP